MSFSVQKMFGLLLVFLAAVYIELHQAQDIPARCSCPETTYMKFIKGNMTNFQVFQKHPGCDKIEFIVTMSKPDNSTEKVCINTNGKMAKAFLRCWERINKDESRKMECIDRKRKAEERASEE
ncbi:chemokine (C-X-C motif) ligand 18b [Pholidichthys leucotaenia]